MSNGQFAKTVINNHGDKIYVTDISLGVGQCIDVLRYLRIKEKNGRLTKFDKGRLDHYKEMWKTYKLIGVSP
jgi:hypothetical protein